MQQNGWVEQTQGETNGKLLQVTTVGQALLNEVLPVWEHAQKECQELIGLTGETALVRLAARLGLSVPNNSKN